MMDCCDGLKSDVLNWMETLRVPGSCCRYRFSAFTDDTIFSTCFALFVLDLFKETDSFTDKQRQEWISHIQGFQNEQYGYFEPETCYHQDKERNLYQLSCFCLSALGLLGTEPRCPIAFIEQWETPDDVKEYLYVRGCHEGRPGSGNKAMFLAIFLTYEYLRTKEGHLLEKINAWFEFHDRTQNPHGFWGKNRGSYYFHGLQNGFHQLLVYFYWRRPINHLDKIVDVALSIQDRDGYFAPTPGGEACHDYDTIHILVNAYKILDQRYTEVAESLKRAFHAILRNKNHDGGFCQSKRSLESVIDLVKSCQFLISGGKPRLWYERLRRCTGRVLRGESLVITGWTEKGRRWNESNLWDTWFRCLSLAEIASTIGLEDSPGLEKTNFHKTLGLGYFSKNSEIDNE